MKVHGVEPTEIKAHVGRYGEERGCTGLLYPFSGDPGLPYNKIFIGEEEICPLTVHLLEYYHSKQVNVVVVTDAAWEAGEELPDGSI